MFADPMRQILEVAERVAISGDKVAVAVLDVGEGTETIDLQFKDKLIGVERLSAAGKSYGA